MCGYTNNGRFHAATTLQMILRSDYTRRFNHAQTPCMSLLSARWRYVNVVPIRPAKSDKKILAAIENTTNDCAGMKHTNYIAHVIVTLQGAH